jgi:hypothetical protein
VISEKTVELNLTTELLNHLWVLTRVTHYVIAPSQREEAKVGFDAGYFGSGAGLFIQFKKAYVDGTVWTWRLNRTAAEDQHLRLQLLESRGVSVFYAFPYFSTESDVATSRRRLLKRTFWVQPSRLNPSGGPTGPHDLSFDAGNSKWRLSSPEPIQIDDPSSTLDELTYSLQVQQNAEGAAARLMSMANAIVLDGFVGNRENLGELGSDRSALDGVCLIARSSES